MTAPAYRYAIVGVVREPIAVVLGILAFACSTGAAWQAGLAWPAAPKRPLARVAAFCGVVLAAFGFSLGYWEVLSGIGDLLYNFNTSIIRVLFDVAAIGLPLAIIGLLLSVAAMLHAADVPPRAVVPALVAGYAIMWLVDPYQALAGPRMELVRQRYVSTPATGASVAPGGQGLFDNFDWGSGGGHGGGGGGGGDGGDENPFAIVLLVVALAVLAVAGGVITAALVFQAGRQKAKTALERHLWVDTPASRIPAPR